MKFLVVSYVILLTVFSARMVSLALTDKNYQKKTYAKNYIIVIFYPIFLLTSSGRKKLCDILDYD